MCLEVEDPETSKVIDALDVSNAQYKIFRSQDEVASFCLTLVAHTAYCLQAL
jgi:hypothetical protein